METEYEINCEHFGKNSTENNTYRNTDTAFHGETLYDKSNATDFIGNLETETTQEIGVSTYYGNSSATKDLAYTQHRHELPDTYIPCHEQRCITDASFSEAICLNHADFFGGDHHEQDNITHNSATNSQIINNVTPTPESDYNHITFMTWNINGWTQENKEIRSKIIESQNADICTLIETHLHGEEKVSVVNYHCFSYNRVLTHNRAKKRYGGLCVLVKKSLFLRYDVKIVDKTYDGILVLMLTNKVTRYSLLIVAAYLPPERSPWGRDAHGFFGHILNLLYEYEYCDNVVVTGDLNSRIGKEFDYIVGVDDIHNRHVIDKNKNSHGSALTDFLLDAKMCICNGRFDKEYDNWTCIKWNGSSVVDYFIVPIDCLNKCSSFKVFTAREMVNKYCDTDAFDIHLSQMIPDHSVLLITVNATCYDNTQENKRGEIINSDCNHSLNIDVDNCDNHLLNVKNNNHVFFQRYNVKTMPPQFMNNKKFNEELLDMIARIEQINRTQDEINDMYTAVCDLYHREMNLFLKKRNVHPTAKKKFNRYTKPFWNDELKTLWLRLCETEKLFLKSQGSVRNRRREDFRNAQKVFDRVYRKAERHFRKNKVEEIEEICTSEPNKFWDTIKKLGPNNRHSIPLKVYDEHGNLTDNLETVLSKWKCDYEALFTFQPEPGVYDDDFYEECLHNLDNLEKEGQVLYDLDYEIESQEVKKVIDNAKCNKSVGTDNLPYEIFKTGATNDLLVNLFNKIYDTGIIPTVWRLAVIKPIPKNSLTDPHLPLQYRGISLLSTVYKLYSSVLNNRIINASEENECFTEEQNGFRKNRSCADHLFTLTSVIRNRKHQRLPTFVAFVDLEKAFDRVDRKLLFYKIRKLGFGGKLYEAIKNIYQQCKARINVSGCLTDEFTTDFGVRQGDCLSPTLFGLFINDLASDIKTSGRGIYINDDLRIKILMYADDLAIISESEEDLQTMLNSLHDWCKKWRMRVNVTKTKVVHFRIKSQPCTTTKFTYGNETMDITDNYKYLGLILDEHLDYNVTASVLSGSAGRALGGICSKFKKLKGLGYQTFTKMFHTGVVPIMDYCSGIWGYQKFGKVESLQNRALKFYLGVHKFSPNLAVNGDMGWVNSSTRRKVEMLRYWNRLIAMDDNRLTKKVFMWDKDKNVRNWSNEIFKIMTDIGYEQQFYQAQAVDLDNCKNILDLSDKELWCEQVSTVSKLRTYITYKKLYDVEPYVYKVMHRGHRSILAQFRTGILPLAVETGRYNDLPLEYRLCNFCNENVLEDEKHFLLNCKLYEEDRKVFFAEIMKQDTLLSDKSTHQKFETLMSEKFVKLTAKFLYTCYFKKRDVLYN